MRRFWKVTNIATCLNMLAERYLGMSKDGFGRWLRIMRIRNGMNQKDLAKELDIDQTTISRLERGAQGMSGPLAAAIARVFNLAVDEVWQVSEGNVPPEDAGAGPVFEASASSRGAVTVRAEGTVITSTVMDIARRIEALPSAERRRVMVIVRAILSTTEDEVERASMLAPPTVTSQPSQSSGNKSGGDEAGQ